MRKLFDRDNVQALLSEVEIKGSKLMFEIGESKAKRARDNYSSSGGNGQQSTAPTVSVRCHSIAFEKAALLKLRLPVMLVPRTACRTLWTL
jgi:hypothetical protein